MTLHDPKTLHDPIEAIIKHAAVSRAMTAPWKFPPTPGIEELMRLRRARRNIKRARRNMREECEMYGYDDPDAWDHGRIVEVPPMPKAERYLRAALEAGGLPEDLMVAIEQYLSKQRPT